MCRTGEWWARGVGGVVGGVTEEESVNRGEPECCGDDEWGKT